MAGTYISIPAQGSNTRPKDISKSIDYMYVCVTKRKVCGGTHIHVINRFSLSPVLKTSGNSIAVILV